jgi:hypothetical protein
MQDLHNNIDAQRVIGPVAIGANATKTGKIIDRQGYGGVEFICEYGAVTTTGSVVTLVVFEGAVTGTMTSVANADLLGTEVLAGLPATTPRTSGVAQNVTKRVGYRGTKRYVRVDSISTGTTSVGCISVAAVLHSPELSPVANP